MEERTRAEHVEWSKERALKCIDDNDLAGAYASIVSDFDMHPDLSSHPFLPMGMNLIMGGATADDMRKWITGFA